MLDLTRESMLMEVAEAVGATDRVEFLRRYYLDPLVHALAEKLIDAYLTVQEQEADSE